MVNDECRYCVCRGDMPKCLETPCNHHDNWMAMELRSKIESQKARIDALMLEYCPDEMTPEQVEEWNMNQKPVSEEKATWICPRCNVDRLKDPCPDNSMNCPMRGEAYRVPNAQGNGLAATNQPKERT